MFVTIAAVLALATYVPAADSYEEQCRNELHLGSDAVTASSAFQLRRCMNLKRIEAEKQEQFDRMLQRFDQRFWQRYEIGEKFLERSRRTLREELRSRRR